jgi:hypothetical protein
MQDPEEDESRATQQQNALLLEVILKLNASRCRAPRRCQRIGCRRSGRCADRAETLRALEPKRKPPEARAPRRARATR